MKRRRLLLLLALVLLVGAVWLASRPRRGDVDTSFAAAKPAPASPSKPADTTPRPPAATPEPSPAAVPPALAEELARLLALSDPEERFRRLDAFWRRWFALDREGVFAALAGLPSGDERAQALSFALPAFAAEEPDRALDLAIALVRDAQESALFAELFDLFTRQDPFAARARLARVPEGSPGFDPAWRACADALAQANLDEALRWAKGLAPGAARTLALETTLYTLAERDALAAFDTTMQTLDGAARDRGLYQALVRIIPGDPAGAAGLIVGMPASPERELAAASAARAWADEAPESALAWAAALPPDAVDSAAAALANIFEIWARKDPAAALSALGALPEGEASAAAAERVATGLAAESPARALAWATTLPDGATRDRAHAASVSTWARTEPAAAAAWVLESGAGGERGAIWSDVISNWAMQDTAAATRYVAALDDPAAQGGAAEALAPYLARENPTAAMTWATGLERAESREKAIIAVYTNWLENDAEAARAWALSPAAPPEVRAQAGR